MLERVAAAVQGTSPQGAFSLLPNHAQFIALISDELVLHGLLDQPPERVPIQQGVLHCRANRVEVYAGLPKLGRERSA